MRSRKFRVLAAWLLFVCVAEIALAQGGYREVGPKEASGILAEFRGMPGFVILDVRTPAEYEEGRIEGAINVDFRSPAFRANLEKFDRGGTYLVYCRTGNRSGQALKLMKELGFGDVIHLSSGIVKWQEEGFPTVRR